MEEETFSPSSRICPPSQNEYITALLSRLENSEEECNRLRQALKHSEGINSQLKAENDQLLNKVTNNPRNTPFSTPIVSTTTITTTTEGHNTNMKQQNEQHKVEIEQIRSELLLLAEGSGSSIDAVAKLKTQVTNLQENKEILIEMKDSLSTLIDDLIGSNKTRTLSSPHGETTLVTKEGLEDIRDKLDMIDLGKKKQQQQDEVEQCDLIAEKVAEAKKKKQKNGGLLLGHRLLPMIEPFFATNEDYGYKIEKPPDEELNTGNSNNKDTNPRMHDSEILGEDIYVPDLPSETHAAACNDNPPWWDVVSLEFDNDVKDGEDDDDDGGGDENNNNNNTS